MGDGFHPSMSKNGFRVELKNEDGYVGTVFLGSSETPVNVLFDTGSDFLAVTSTLCNDPKLGKQEQDEVVFDSKSLTYKNKGKDLRKCKSTAYNLAESVSASQVKNADDQKLDYGSATLNGKLYNDKVCVDGNKTTCTNFTFVALY
jgi:hypothetical protein